MGDTGEEGMRVLILFCLLLGVSGVQVRAQERGFAMGFTPFPHDVSLAAMAEVKGFIARHADMVAVHLEHVPWDEARRRGVSSGHDGRLADEAVPPAGRWEAVSGATPLDLGRRGLASIAGQRRGSRCQRRSRARRLPRRRYRRPIWSTAGGRWSSSGRTTCIGIEVNELYHNARQAWPGYAALHRSTYAALKKEHPGLPIFVSFTLHNMLNPAWAIGRRWARPLRN